MKFILAFLFLFILHPFSNLGFKAQVVSFPGAEGFGRFTTGGRGGDIIEVTNLNDDGDGSLRKAIDKSGKRIIVFKVSGTIELNSNLVIEHGDLTIAGQTAPGDGICLKNYKTVISADNVIIRFLRFRLGDKTKLEDDAIGSIGHKNIIIDHCSMSWAIDENASFYDNENFTMQWCIISEALNNSYHHKGEHGYGGIWGGHNASFHHNLLAHNSSRNPRFNGGRTSAHPELELVDFRNNVIYNWGINSSYGGEKGKCNIVNNYYKSGLASEHKNRIVEIWDDSSKWFVDGNFVEGFPEITSENWNGGVQGEFAKHPQIKSPLPFPNEFVSTSSALDAYKDVLKYSGCILPIRDDIDLRIINEAANGKIFKGNGIINSQEDVGGWCELKSIQPPVDSDRDGIPDEWEIKHGLNPDNYEDSKIISANGYANIELYLNYLVESGMNLMNKE